MSARVEAGFTPKTLGEKGLREGPIGSGEDLSPGHVCTKASSRIDRANVLCDEAVLREADAARYCVQVIRQVVE
jgi:hypothetical protein